MSRDFEKIQKDIDKSYISAIMIVYSNRKRYTREEAGNGSDICKGV